MILIKVLLVLTAVVVGKRPNIPPKDVLGPSLVDSSHSLRIKTYVLNCFPNTNVTAFVIFEQDRVSRLQYGRLSIVNATLQPNSDFIIQFRQRPTDGESLA